MGRKVCLRCKGKTLLGLVNKLLKTKSEGDGIESSLPFKKCSILRNDVPPKTWDTHIKITNKMLNSFNLDLASWKLINQSPLLFCFFHVIVLKTLVTLCNFRISRNWKYLTYSILRSVCNFGDFRWSHYSRFVQIFSVFSNKVTKGLIMYFNIDHFGSWHFFHRVQIQTFFQVWLWRSGCTGRTGRISYR